MAIKFHLIEPDMVLYEHRKTHRFGCAEIEYWPVRIVSVDKEKETAVASWNNNPAREMSKRNLENLFRNKPKRKTNEAKKEE